LYTQKSTQKESDSVKLKQKARFISSLEETRGKAETEKEKFPEDSEEIETENGNKIYYVWSERHFNNKLAREHKRQHYKASDKKPPVQLIPEKLRRGGVGKISENGEEESLSPIFKTLHPKIRKGVEELGELLDIIQPENSPPLKIYIHNNKTKPIFSTNLNLKGEGEIHLSLGYFSLVKDINELAGLLILQIERLRDQSVERKAKNFQELGIQAGKGAKDEIEKKIQDEKQKIEDKHENADPEQLETLKRALEIVQFNAGYEDRAKKEHQILEASGIHLSISDDLKRKILLGKRVMDRMADLGFDPSSLIDPRQRELKMNAQSSISPKARSLLKSLILGSGAFSKKKKVDDKSIDVELKALNLWNIAMTKYRPGGLSQLAYKGDPLPETLALWNQHATLLQFLTLRGVAKQVLGPGVISLVTILGLKSAWHYVGSPIVDFFEASKDSLDQSVKESDIEIDTTKATDAIGSIFSSAGEKISDGAAVVGDQLIKLQDPLDSTIDFVMANWEWIVGAVGSLAAAKIISNLPIKESILPVQRLNEYLKKDYEILEQIKANKSDNEESVDNTLEMINTFQRSSVYVNEKFFPMPDYALQVALYHKLFTIPERSFFSRFSKSLKLAENIQPFVDHVRELAIEELKKENPKFNPDSKFSEGKIFVRMRKIAREALIYNREDIIPDNVNKESLERSQDHYKLKIDQKRPNLLKSLRHLPILKVHNSIAKKIINEIERIIKEEKPSEEEKQKLLNKLSEINFDLELDKKNNEQVLKLFKEHHSHSSLLGKGFSEMLKKYKGKIPQNIVNSYIYINTKEINEIDDLIAVIEYLIENEKHSQAIEVASNNIDLLLSFDEELLFPLLTDILKSSAKAKLANPLQLFKYKTLFPVKLVSKLSTEQSIGFLSHYLNRGTSLKTIALKPILNLLIKKNLKVEESIEATLKKYDRLKASGLEESYMSQAIFNILKNKTWELSEKNLNMILERDYLLKKLVNLDSISAKSYQESSLLYRQRELAKKHPAYKYDPNFVLEIHGSLSQEYWNELGKKSPGEQFKRLTLIASKGPSHITDQKFQEILTLAPSPEIAGLWAKEILNKKLIKNSNVESDFFKALHEENFTPEELVNDSYKAIDSFLDQIQSYDIEKHKESIVKEYQLDDKQAEILQNSHLSSTDKGNYRLHANDRSPLKFLAQDSFIATTSTEKKLIEKLNRRLSIFANETDPKQKTILQNKVNSYVVNNLESFLKMSRRGILYKKTKHIIDQFSDGGEVAASLLNWIAEHYQLNQEDAFFLRDKISAFKKNSSDNLATNVLKFLEAVISERSKSERWAAIKWLRGTGEIPFYIKARFENINPESIRSFYAFLPVQARAVFLESLLYPTNKSLLEGSTKKVYEEQIFNEILPKDEKNSKIASDLIKAFLMSVEEVNSEKIKNTTLAFLLANHNDDEQGVGKILRNVLENYGTVGIKFGQLLAASDILPDEIRNELKQLRDGATPPLWHQIYERLQQLLKVENVNSYLKIKKLLGSASIKYTLLVEENNPQNPEFSEEIALGVKKEDAQNKLSDDLKMLKIIIDEMIRKNPKQNSLLAGIAAATKDAILREMSFVRETTRSDQAEKLYKKLKLPDGVKLHFPKNSSLIDRLPGPKKRKVNQDGSISDSIYDNIRTTEFVSGKTLEKLDPISQELLATTVLSVNEQILFAEESDTVFDEEVYIVFDPDRHPGNELAENVNNTLIYSPIDWGQLLTEFTPKHRDKIIQTVALSQVMKTVGAPESIIKELIKLHEVPPENVDKLKRLLSKFFPSQNSDSALKDYYLLLSVLNKSGVMIDLRDYEFLKAIYQLEAYEEVLDNTTIATPKKRLAKEVLKNVKKYSKDVYFSNKDIIRQALFHTESLPYLKKIVKHSKNNTLNEYFFFDLLKFKAKDIENLTSSFKKQTSSTSLKEALDFTKSKVEQFSEEFHEQHAYFNSDEFHSMYNTLQGNEKLEEASVYISNKDIVIKVESKNRKILNSVGMHNIPKQLAENILSYIAYFIISPEQLSEKKFITALLNLGGSVLGYSTIKELYNKLIAHRIPMSLSKFRELNQTAISTTLGLTVTNIIHKVFSDNSMRLPEAISSTLNAAEIASLAAGIYTVDKAIDYSAEQLGHFNSSFNRLHSSNSCPRLLSKIPRHVLLLGGGTALAGALVFLGKKSGVLEKNEFDMLKSEITSQVNKTEEELDLIVQKAKNTEDLCEFYKTVYDGEAFTKQLSQFHATNSENASSFRKLPMFFDLRAVDNTSQGNTVRDLIIQGYSLDNAFDNSSYTAISGVSQLIQSAKEKLNNYKKQVFQKESKDFLQAKLSYLNKSWDKLEDKHRSLINNEYGIVLRENYFKKCGFDDYLSQKVSSLEEILTPTRKLLRDLKDTPDLDLCSFYKKFIDIDKLKEIENSSGFKSLLSETFVDLPYSYDIVNFSPEHAGITFESLISSESNRRYHNNYLPGVANSIAFAKSILKDYVKPYRDFSLSHAVLLEYEKEIDSLTQEFEKMHKALLRRYNKNNNLTRVDSNQAPLKNYIIECKIFEGIQ